MIETSLVNKILVITLSNIGDVILTFPVLDILKRDFPRAQISVVVGPKGEPLLRGNPHLHRVIVFDKRQSWPAFRTWLGDLRQQDYDLAIDLRNTAIPFLVKARWRTSFLLRRIPGELMVQQHLKRLRSVYPFPGSQRAPSILTVEPREQQAVNEIMMKKGLVRGRFLVIAPGAAAEEKRWNEKGFALLSDRLMDLTRCSLAWVGDAADLPVAERIGRLMKNPSVNLCGQTTLQQLSVVLSNCRLLVVNDSAPLHLASYLNVPVVGIFGPTDPSRYGPWGEQGCWVAKKEGCPACQKREKNRPHTCLSAVTPQDVINTLRETPWGREMITEPS